MESHKFSASIPESLFVFLGEYQRTHHLRTRSEVIGRALRLLRQMELEEHYRNASDEIDDAFAITDEDGLEDEAW